MKLILDLIAQRAACAPLQSALICRSKEDKTLTNKELITAISAAEACLRTNKVSCLGILMDNCAEWVIYDLAAAKLGICVVPIPLFFTPMQVKHLLVSANVDFVVSNAEYIVKGKCLPQAGAQHVPAAIANCFYMHFSETSSVDRTPKNIAKITFTSGSTGEPKGVCLTHENIEAVCLSLQQALHNALLNDHARHLCVMPLATLLENIAGVYLPLMRGGTVITQPIQTLGFESNSQFDATKLIKHLGDLQVGSMILFPQILENLVKQPGSDLSKAIKHMEFVAVGGGTVSENVLQQAQQMGLPVFQGYGLSECGSVVCLNLPGNNKIGSVGRVLDHVALTVNDEGEIIVHGQSMSCYLGEVESEVNWVATGDLGYIDQDGFVFVTGRKKNTLVSSFGRNVSPEWISTLR